MCEQGDDEQMPDQSHQPTMVWLEGYDILGIHRTLDSYLECPACDEGHLVVTAFGPVEGMGYRPAQTAYCPRCGHAGHFYASHFRSRRDGPPPTDKDRQRAREVESRLGDWWAHRIDCAVMEATFSAEEKAYMLAYYEQRRREEEKCC